MSSNSNICTQVEPGVVFVVVIVMVVVVVVVVVAF